MGNRLFDQYTYLHFASGIIAYFWGLRLKTFIISRDLFLKTAIHEPATVEQLNGSIENFNCGRQYPRRKFEISKIIK